MNESTARLVVIRSCEISLCCLITSCCAWYQSTRRRHKAHILEIKLLNLICEFCVQRYKKILTYARNKVRKYIILLEGEVGFEAEEGGVGQFR